VNLNRPIKVAIALLLSALLMRHRVEINDVLRPEYLSILRQGKECQTPSRFAQRPLLTISPLPTPSLGDVDGSEQFNPTHRVLIFAGLRNRNYK
jgi:hypothetical protein